MEVEIVATSGEGQTGQESVNEVSGGLAENSNSGTSDSLKKESKSARNLASPDDEFEELTVDGKTVKWSRAQLKAYASKAHVADKKFQEAAQIRKENLRLMELAKKSPMEALLDPSLGLSKEQIKEAIENYYNKEYIEPEELTEEQRELKTLREERNKYLSQREEQEKIEKSKLEEKEDFENQKVFQTKIINNLEKSGVAKTPFFASRVAFYMAQNLKQGWQAPDELIMDQVKNEQDNIFGQLNARPVAELIKLFPDLCNKLRIHDLNELRAKKYKTNPSLPPRDAGNAPKSKNAKIDSHEVDKRMKLMKAGIWD